MSDGSVKKIQGIPSWQKTASTTSDNHQPEQESTADVSQDNPTLTVTTATKEVPEAFQTDQDTVVKQALKFLRDEGVRDASDEEKIAFLESKGLSKADIEAAVALVKNEIKNPTLLDTKSVSFIPTATSPDFAQAFVAEQARPPIPQRDVTPIITYPEFLVQPQKPPPLITAQRLLTTAYIGGGVSAAIYGASKFLITPMTEALTHARHEFAENAQERLDELNHKLSNIVSVDPKTNLNMRINLQQADSVSEADTTDSDPTELFHRDYGTQTSPVLKAAPSHPPSDMSSLELDSTNETVKTVNSELIQLSSLKSSCSALNDRNASETSGTEEISNSIKSLRQYLDLLINPPYNYSSSNQVSGTKADGAKTGDDEIQKLKAEIRGVKGVLLSARNFPSGGRRAIFPSPATAG